MDKEAILKESLLKLDNQYGSKPSYEKCLQRARICKIYYQYNKADIEYKDAIFLYQENHFIDYSFKDTLASIYEMKADNLAFSKNYYESDEDYTTSIVFIKDLKPNKSRYNDLSNLFFKSSKVKFEMAMYKDALKNLKESLHYQKCYSEYRGYSVKTDYEKIKLLANIYFLMEDFENANETCNLISESEDWDELDFVAMMKEKLGDNEGAIKILTKAIEINGKELFNPGGPSYHYFENDSKGMFYVKRGLLLSKTGKTIDAYKDYIKAYENDKEIVKAFNEVFNDLGFKQYLETYYYK